MSVTMMAGIMAGISLLLLCVSVCLVILGAFGDSAVLICLGVVALFAALAFIIKAMSLVSQLWVLALS